VSPDKKVGSRKGCLFYQGHEIVEQEFDNVSITKLSTRSPWKVSEKNLFDGGGKLRGRTNSGRNLFEVAFQNFE
jgi:hypothetical protein